jgi:hypothetical protein
MAATTAVVAGTATAVSGRVARRQAAKNPAPAEAPPQEAAPEPVAAEMPPPAPAAPAGGLTPEAMSQLQELGALHEQGVLTDDEFEAQKAKILG